MCGLAGGFWRQAPGNLEARIDAALTCLRHRGPNDQGYEAFRNPEFTLALGQTRLSVIDLSAGGKLMFQVPHGDTPDNVRNHPLLKGMNIPKTGQGSSVGIMVTKTMLVAGDPQITAPPGRGRGAMLRAYDKKDGHEIGAVLMPAAISGVAKLRLCSSGWIPAENVDCV